MVNLVLVSHGDMADGLLNALSLIVGKQEGIVTINLTEADSISDLENRVDSAIQELSKEASVLLMVDLIGASPFNVCVKLLSRYPDLQVVTGINLPMLLETTMQRETQPVNELVKIAAEAGRNGIRTMQELIDQAAQL